MTLESNKCSNKNRCMTSTTAYLVPGAAPTADPVAELHACLSRLQAYDVSRLDAGGLSRFVTEVARAESRLAGIRLQALAAAERTQTAAQCGAASTGQWAARLANADQAEVHREVRLAQDLEERTYTQRALVSGFVS